MLDDLKYIHEKDSSDAIGSAARMLTLLGSRLNVTGSLKYGDIENIIVAAMGDSSLSAMIARVFPGTTLPLEIVRDYTLPPYANDKSLVILASYSGNTEETLSIYAAAKARGCRLAVIAGGGRLLGLAKQDGVPFIKIPQHAQPRYAGLYMFRALLDIVGSRYLVAEPAYEAAIRKACDMLQEPIAGWAPDRPTAVNAAKRLALEIMGKSVVIYSGSLLYPAAYKWKLGINQNAKQIAWTSQLPEYNHNEMTGWTKQPVNKPYAVLELLSSLEHPRVVKRFEIGDRLTSGMRPEAIRIQAEGDTVIAQLLYLFVFGEMVSIYLALLNGIDPAPLKLVDKFKEEMGDFSL